jgi:hypothetical protein
VFAGQPVELRAVGDDRLPVAAVAGDQVVAVSAPSSPGHNQVNFSPPNRTDRAVETCHLPALPDLEPSWARISVEYSSKSPSYSEHHRNVTS